MKTKQIIKAILHIEDAATICVNVPAAYIGKTRDGLRCWAPQCGEHADTMRAGADFIQTILDAKHACPNAKFGGYGGEFGAHFEAEFAATKPAANRVLANRLMLAAEALREANGLTGKKLSYYMDINPIRTVVSIDGIEL